MWPNPLETGDLVTFTEDILNRNFHFFVQCLQNIGRHRLNIQWIEKPLLWKQISIHQSLADNNQSYLRRCILWKVSVVGVILVQILENTDQNNSEYGHVLRIDGVHSVQYILIHFNTSWRYSKCQYIW